MSPIIYKNFLTFVIAALFISGCSPQVEDAVSLDYQPIYPMTSEVLTSSQMVLFTAYKLLVYLPQTGVRQRLATF